MSIEAMKQALDCLQAAYNLQQIDDLIPAHAPVKQAVADLRQAIEQAEKQVCVGCEGNPQGENIPCAVCGATLQPNVTANDTKQECVAKPQEKRHEWAWMPAPIKTQWGHDMVVADLAIDKDHTVSVYCERDQTARVEAMFNRGC